MKISRVLSIALSLALSAALVIADDGLLGEKRGKGGGSGSGGGGSVGSGGGKPSGGSGGGKPSGGGGGAPGGVKPGSGGGGAPGGVKPGSSGNSGGGSRGNSEPPTRVESRGNQGRQPTGGPVRVQSQTQSRTGRSGTSNYRTQNNGQTRDPQRVDSIPNYRRSIESQSRSENGLPYSSRYRTGYNQYNRGWCDDNFWYPHYDFSFNSRSTIFSPWYCYTTLPGYIDVNRVRFGGRCHDLGLVVNINWSPNYRYDRGSEYYELNGAVQDLTRVFSRHDLRALDRLVPQDGWVYISGDWEEDYELRADDFYDMMRDLVDSTRTRVFAVTCVEEGRYGARVKAEHVYIDAWGRENRVYMTFTMEENRRGDYEIVEMSTSLRRPR